MAAAGCATVDDHDPIAAPQGGSRVAAQVFGPTQDLGPAQDPGSSAARGQGPTQPEITAQEPAEPAERATLRARFGSTILIAADGTVTKQYFVTGEAGQVLVNLLQDPEAIAPHAPDKPVPSFGPLRIGGAAGGHGVLAQMLGEHEVEVFYLESFEKPEGVAIRAALAVPSPAEPSKPVWDGLPQPVAYGAPNSLLLVSAKPAALAAFEGALNLFFANVPQVEIEIKVVEYTTSQTLAFGVEPIDATTPTLDQLGNNRLVQDIVTQFPLAAPFVGGTNVTSRGILTLGGIHDSWALNAQLEVLEARGVADVLSRPRLVVRNGGTASVVTKTELPYPQAQISSSGQNITANIQFKPVGITLNIRPVIAGPETVILQVYANVSEVTSFSETDPVNTPVVSRREVVTSVHVSDGKTTVLGGLTSSATFEQTSQVPILGDIPILGWLFRSTATTQNRTTLEFHITPKILRGPGSFLGGGA